ncbi:GntR family transcriptional regulator [Pseudonocardia sp. CA-107938]|uniref:GntR family transcriptional regulator n=1 Tax=Pseudonocardia sp. CA-107938 TaxID=3240021 RepID=UPI003D8B5957
MRRELSSPRITTERSQVRTLPRPRICPGHLERADLRVCSRDTFRWRRLARRRPLTRLSERCSGHGAPRLAVELREKILNGEHAAGDHLPGGKALAVEYGLSSSTVKRAFDLLHELGLDLRRREGVAPRSAGSATTR